MRLHIGGSFVCEDGIMIYVGMRIDYYNHYHHYKIKLFIFKESCVDFGLDYESTKIFLQNT